MRLAFVNPSLTGGRARGALEPLWMAALAAATPPWVERRAFDECVEPVDLDAPVDLVAMTCSTFTARRAYQLARAFRARGVPVVLGGYHPTLQPAEALRFADAVMVGEAEELWPRILEDARAGRLRRVYRGRPASLAGLRFDRSVYAGRRYQPLGLVQFGRGCRFQCDFCSIPPFFSNTRRQRPVREVAAEIEALGRRTLFFVDDNLHVGGEGTGALVDALRPLGVRWSCQASLDFAQDDGLVRRMARSGCFGVLVGFEALRRDVLQRMGKTFNKGRAHYEAAVRRLHDAGILVYGTFVVGYDDGPEALDEILDFAERSRLFLAAFNLLTPIPGTPAYRRLRAEGRLVAERWWLDPSTRFARPVVRPPDGDLDALEARCRAVRRRFYGWPGIVARALGTPTNRRRPWRLPLWLAFNAVYRREALRLQSQPLGDPADLSPLLAPAAGEGEPRPPAVA
ncbi:MAG TPA: radical SAM protein [Anaeromyxobacteraceae bacterium]|nr:radical SAM protein [Anaeromyxobacteraceae bacterium]